MQKNGKPKASGGAKHRKRGHGPKLGAVVAPNASFSLLIEGRDENDEGLTPPPAHLSLL